MKRRNFLSNLGALAALSVLPEQKRQMPEERMRITASGKLTISTTGNVGTGTNTPAYKFELRG
jgi:hypothetical protein